MARERELRVKIVGDATDAQRAFSKLDDSVDRSEGRISQMSGRMKLALAGAVAGAGTAAVKFGISSVKAFGEAQESQARLEDAFARFPKLADTNAAALRKLNTQLANKTRFDDDATASGQAVLAQFDLTGKQVTDLTPLLQDYAARTGKDLPDAAEDLGKAILGQGRALKAIGIEFKDTGSAAGNFEQLMAGLRTQVGGFAEKEGETAQGKLAILQNRFGEVQEKLGEKLLPVLLKLSDWLLEDGIPALERLGGWIGTVAGAFGDFARVVKDVATEAVQFFVDKFLAAVEWIVRAGASAFGWVPGIGPKLREAAREIEAFRDEANRALSGIQREINLTVVGAVPGQAGKSFATLPGAMGPPTIINNNVTVNARTNASGEDIAREVSWRGRSGWR